MKSRTLYFAGLVVVIAIGTAVIMAFSTVWHLAIYSAIPFLSSLFGIILALTTLLVWLQTRAKESARLVRIRKWLFLTSVFFLLQVAYFPVALSLRDLEVNRAKNFINAIIPKLEEYKRLNNEYPANIEFVLSGDEKVPGLLQLSGNSPLEYDNSQYYVLRGATYGFRFYLPDGFIGFHYEYCCGLGGVWTVTD